MNTRHRNSLAHFSIKAWIRHGIHFMYAVFIEPHSENEDIKRNEFILNTLLCCITGLLIVLDIYIGLAAISKGALYDGIPFTYFTLLIIIFVCLHCHVRDTINLVVFYFY